MNHYLVIDGMLSGTGIRDQYETGYLEPQILGLSDETLSWLNEWRLRYADQHHHGYQDRKIVAELDAEGVNIARQIKHELPEAKISYFSDALMQLQSI